MASIANQPYLRRHAEHISPAKTAASNRSTDMLDLAFLVTGAAFLAACGLYAFACDRL
jgi:hypothetical protein